ncbi:MAG: hypothetical protein R2792_14935 [Saprospiraceae bacterium]
MNTLKGKARTWFPPLGFTVLFSLLVGSVLFQNACKDPCPYDMDPTTPLGCVLTDTLNLSTGLDTSGNIIPPGFGVVDPYWILLNNPPLINCTDPVTSTINGSAYLINYNNFGPTAWANQAGAGTLAPVDLGTTQTFGCNNAFNSNGEQVPYVFERSFCVLKSTMIDFAFTLKGDDVVCAELIDNSTGTVVNSSSCTTGAFAAPLPWSASGLTLPTGSYSIRAYLTNTQSTVLGFSLAGNLTTSNGDESLSNNAGSCCENNTISVLNILEEICDGQFGTGDQPGTGWTINLFDSSNTLIRSTTTDVNGNIFFAGLPDGTYTISIVPQGGWTPNTVSQTVTLSNNDVQIIEFYNCR